MHPSSSLHSGVDFGVDSGVAKCLDAYPATSRITISPQRLKGKLIGTRRLVPPLCPTTDVPPPAQANHAQIGATWSNPAQANRAQPNPVDGVEMNLEGMHLEQALVGVGTLERAKLRGANLRWAYLKQINLQGADLRYADLTGAYLRGADLRGADLRFANLQGALLWEANLEGARLDQACLQGCSWT
jgi:hypothetical protein